MSEKITKKLMLFFPRCECEKPIIYQLVKDYDLIVNIFRAKVTPEEEGYLVLDITGTKEDIQRALDYIKTLNVTISTKSKGLIWDREKCTHCAHCLPYCPTNALHLADQATREVVYDESKCIECLACIRVCPFNACKSAF